MGILDGILQTFYRMLTVLFNEIFSPILMDILSVFGEVIIADLALKFSYLAFLLLIFLCGILDGLEGMINVFAGTAQITVDNKPMTLTQMVFQLDVISRGFLLVTVVGVGFCLLFTIFATARSISSMTLENRNPITHVLKNAFKAATSFLMVPLLCIFLLQLTTAMTMQIQTSVLNQKGIAGNPSTGTYIFLVSSLRAGKQKSGILEDFLSKVKDGESGYREPDLEDDLRVKYLNGTKDYRDLSDSGVDFSPARVDYLMGFVAVIFMILMFVGLIIQFIRRLLELVMLYLTAPFFAATIPGDDGAMFTRWREMFVAKFLSSFGVIFSLKIFLLLLPIIFSNKLDLGSAMVHANLGFGPAFESGAETGNDKAVEEALQKNGMSELQDHAMMDNVMYSMGLDAEDQEASTIDSILKLLFMMGGVLAIYKSQSMVLEVLNPQVAQETREAVMLAAVASMKAAKMAGDIGIGVATGGTGTAAMAGAKAGMAAGKAGISAGQAMAKTAGNTIKNGAKDSLKSAAKSAAGSAGGSGQDSGG